MARRFTAVEATRILDAFDAFTEVRAKPGMNDLAVLVSLNVALQANGIIIAHLPDAPNV